MGPIFQRVILIFPLSKQIISCFHNGIYFSLMITLGILKEFLCDLFTTCSNRVAGLDSCTVMFLDETTLRKQNKNANQYLRRVILHIPVHVERYN
jgi:hypothetical protein